MPTLYLQLADHFIRCIDEGIYKTGDKLPGVRRSSEREGVSPATAVAAYRELELRGYIEARPRSGYYVKQRHQHQLAEPNASKPPRRPGQVSGQELVLQLARDSGNPRLTNLATGIPHTSLLPTTMLSKALTTIAREHRSELNQYAFPPGYPALREALAKRLAQAGCLSDPEDILITNGCHEALFLSLKTVTQPGDIVAVESPVYHGLLQVIDALGLKALEIPTHPRDGISLEALTLALDQWPVRACVIIPNFSNPQGYLMPEARKAELAKLFRQHPDVTLIEDDICGDLAFDGQRPKVVKGFASPPADVILCSSVSKTLSPGLRVGWVVSGKHRESLRYQKFITNSATPVLNQMAVAHMFNSGRYDRHLKFLRQSIAQTMDHMLSCIGRYFPEGTRVTRPRGGLVLWLELDKGVSADTLRVQAFENDISIIPGNLFSPSGKYRHCLRLPCALPWNPALENAVKKVGELAEKTS